MKTDYLIVDSGLSALTFGALMANSDSPTTNERFCWCPNGNSYGSSLTPRNMGLGRLNHETSLHHFYFCNASSGYPVFAPTIWTGALLYQRLSGDVILGES
jgi:hypothetical protein